MTPLRTPEDVAARLQVAPKSVRALARARKLVGIKVGQAWRFADEDVDAYLGRQRQAPAPDAVTPSSAYVPPSIGLSLPKHRRFS